jgi:methyl-accepting chemotaxis protein
MNIQENGMSKTHRRKKYFFQDSFQGKYLLSYFILACLVIAFFTALFIYFSTDTLSITYENDQLKFGKTPEVLLESLINIHGILIVFSGLGILYFFTRFTHKTAGPIFKIERSLDTMATGDLTLRVHLRKKDECKALADRLNNFNATIYGKLKEIEEQSITIETLFKELDLDGLNDNQRITIDTLKAHSGRLRHTLTFFNLSKDPSEE